MYYNKNAGDPTKWTYDPDLSRQATDDGTWKNVSLRLTVQATPRNKVNLFWDEQDLCVSCIGGGNATTAPEAATETIGRPQRAQQITWTSPVTNRLLFEAGFGTVLIRYGGLERDGNNRDLIRVVERRTGILGSHLPGAELVAALERDLRLARLGVVHHRRPQREGRLLGLFVRCVDPQFHQQRQAPIPVQ